MSKRLSRIATVAGFVLLWPGIARAQDFLVNNLVTDDPSVHPAQITDPLAKNIWGMSASATSPFWVSNNATGTSTLYKVIPATDMVTPVTVPNSLPALIPGDGSVTGQVFNTGIAGNAFNKDNFLFVSEDGTISGWRGGVSGTGATAETLLAADKANVYKGAAFATTGGHSYLYAANFRAGTIDTFQDSIATPVFSGKFQDPSLPAGYAPFNIQRLGNTLYVAYAEQDGMQHDEVAGAGKGYVDAYDLSGNFLGRVGTGGTLNAPWGLAIAPGSYGKFAGDLLVGNFGDGTINAYDLGTDTFVGQLDGIDGNPLALDGLWGLMPGNDGNGGSSSRIYFASGPDGETHGLFGSLAAVPEPGVNAMLAAGMFSAFLLATRRTRKRA